MHSSAQNINISHSKSRSFDRLIEWLGMRDSNPRMRGPEPRALPLGQSPILTLFYPKVGFELLINGIRLAFCEPEISFSQTSLKKKVSLQYAAGIFHPECVDQNHVPCHDIFYSRKFSTPPQLGDLRQPCFRSCKLPLAIFTLGQSPITKIL